MSDSTAPAPGLQEKRIRFQSKAMQAGFTAVPNIVIDNVDLSPQARLLYVILCKYARLDDSCFPGIDGMMKLLCVTSTNTLRAYRKELEDARLIQTIRRGQGLTNLTEILDLPEPQGVEGLDPQPTEHSSKEEEYAVEEEREGAHPLIKHYFDRAKVLNRYTNRNHALVLAKRIDEALEAGASPLMIKNGIEVLLVKGLQPSALHSAISEAQAKNEPIAANPNFSAPMPYSCPQCGVGLKGPQAVKEHLYHLHDGPDPYDH